MAVDIKISGENLLEWSHMEDWENGASSAPTEHTLSGSGASISQESTIIKFGTYSAKVTRSGADATLYHDFTDYDDYKNRKMTFGCWVYATVASRGRIAISDGVGSTNSSYHTGGSGWEFLEVTHDVDASATRIRVEMQVNTGDTVVYFDGGVLVEDSKVFNNLTNNVDIGKWSPSVKYKTQRFNIARREGSIIPNTTLDSKTIRVEGMVVESDSATARSTYDDLIKDLSSYRIKPNGERQKKNLYLFDDRYLNVFLQMMTPSPIAALKVIEFTASFIAPDPSECAVNKTRSATTIDSSPKSITVTTNGTVTMKPIIRVTAGSADITALTVENLTTAQKFSYTATITSGEILVLNTDLLTVTNNGTDDLSNTTNELALRLIPGDNEILVTITGGSTDSVIKIDWFNKYL